MTLEEQLKKEILSKYKSVRAFTTSIDVPYSTLDSVFKRGISNAGVSTMIKVFNALNLDIESIRGDTLLTKDTPTKKAPSTAEAAPGEDVLKIFDYLNNALISAGLIREEEDITDQQAQVLLGICAILRSTFEGEH